MTNPLNCPGCGAALPKNGALRGLCPACLLRRDAVAAGEFVRTGGGGPLAPPPDLSRVQRDFPQLEILELVGRGGMGLVYKARQPRLDRIVALKILSPELARDPAFAERFLREAQALARLNHPNVVTVFDFGEREGCYFLLMEFVDGVSLRHVLEQGRLGAEEALRLVPEICAGLQYAHEQGIVHRDIKPENILIDSVGRVKIADFGLVKLLGHDDGDWRLTRASQVMGTPQYMAPEQMNRPQEVDHRADIYSLGVVLYEMLTADLPTGRFALPSERVPVDERLDEVVLRALAREPEKRYQRANEMGTRLSTISAGPAVQPKPKFRRGRRASTSEPWPRDGRISFTNEDKWDGLIVTFGLLGLNGDRVYVEYRTRDCFGFKKSEVVTKEFPISDIGAASCQSTWTVPCYIYLTATNMDAFDGFPEHRAGVIRFKITRADADAAKRFVAHLNDLLEARA